MRIVLAPGLQGTAENMRPHVEGLQARGIEARAIDLPRRMPGAAARAFLAASGDGDDVVIGGFSNGARVASLLAAGIGGGEHRFAGLVLIGYPLHPKNTPRWHSRTRHWSHISCPVLVLAGEADKWSNFDLLQIALSERLPHATVVSYPGVSHYFVPVLDDALDRIAEFASDLERRRRNPAA